MVAGHPGGPECVAGGREGDGVLRERQRDRLGEGGWWCCMSRTRTVLFALALRSRQRQKQASLMSMSTLRGAATWVARRVWGWQMFYFSWASRHGHNIIFLSKTGMRRQPSPPRGSMHCTYALHHRMPQSRPGQGSPRSPMFTRHFRSTINGHTDRQDCLPPFRSLHPSPFPPS